MRRTFLVVLTALLTTELAAVNTNFLPGDSFFHFVLSDREAAKLPETTSPIFRYERHQREDGVEVVNFCGYVGYGGMQYRNMPLKIRRAMAQVHADLRKKDEKERQKKKAELEKIPKDAESNDTWQEAAPRAIHVFVYNENFDVGRFALFLKYNEKWSDELEALGQDREHVWLESFVSGFTALEWRDASAASQLRLEYPKKSQGPAGRIPFARRGLKFVMVLGGDFDPIAHRKDGARFIEISRDGVRHYISKNYKWVVEKHIPFEKTAQPAPKR